MSKQMTRQTCPTKCDLPLTRRGHERWLALLLSATELFLEKGYDAVSLDDVVNHAGGSKASIYKYFGSKEGLFTAICDYRRELFFKNICASYDAQQDDLRSFLTSTLYNFFAKITCTENSAFMRLLIEQSQRNPDLALYLHQKGPEYIQKCIADALQYAAEKGQIECKKPLNSAMVYFGILRNIEWKIIMGVPLTTDCEDIHEHIDYCVDLFLNAHKLN